MDTLIIGLLIVLFVGVPGYYLLRWVARQDQPSGESRYCTRCGHRGPAKRIMPGSIVMELAAWLFFLLPGLIYSVWRHHAAHPGCAQCGSSELIPVDSPRARQLMGTSPAQTLTKLAP